MRPYLRAANVVDGGIDLSDVKEMNFSPNEQQLFALRQGDVLMTEGSGSINAVGASAVWSGGVDGVVCFQNTLLRLRARPLHAGQRYVAWLARYARAAGLLAGIAGGANIHHLSAERVRSLAVPVPPRAQQEAIADFLDVETTRIDALIAKKLHLIRLLQAQFVTLRVDALIDRTEWPVTRLKYLLESTRAGTWGSEVGVDEADVVCIRVADFDRVHGSTVLDNGATIRSLPASEVGRLRLATGDLLLEKSGGGEGQPVGTVVQFLGESGDQPAVCSNFVLRMRPSVGVDSGFARHVFCAMYDSKQTRPWIKQTTGIQNLDVPSYLGRPCRIPELAQQVAIREHLDRARSRCSTIQAGLCRQIELVHERRQALITAAVTGQIDIPGVAP